MNLLAGKKIPHFKVIPIIITQEVIDIVETLSNKDGIKSPLNFKDCKKGTIHNNDYENYYNDA